MRRSPLQAPGLRSIGPVALALTATFTALGAGAPGVAASAPFPVTVGAANGSVHLAVAPKRIVVLSPTATDMLFAIGAGSQVVAVDADSTYPAGVPTTSLSGLTPNVEAIAKYRPDLVVISYAPAGFLSELAKLKIPVLEEPAAAALSDSYAQLTALGKATGHGAKAAAVVASMRSRIAALVAKTPRPSGPRTYYYELDQTYYSATSSTFIGSILTRFGLRDIADGKGKGSAYPQLTSEYIVKADPSIIFLADTVCCGQTAKTVAKRPGWAAVAAVKNHEVIGLNDSVASEWGPRVVTLVGDVSVALAAMHDNP